MNQPALASVPDGALEVADRLSRLDAGARVDWVLENLPGPHVLSSSFGAQSAVMLHLVAKRQPDIPVVVIDTGYLFPETYAFIDTLAGRLGLNLHIARPTLSPAWLEARHGKLWEQGADGLTEYNRLAKDRKSTRLNSSHVAISYA